MKIMLQMITGRETVIILNKFNCLTMNSNAGNLRQCNEFSGSITDHSLTSQMTLTVHGRHSISEHVN